MINTPAPLQERLDRRSEIYIEGRCQFWWGSRSKQGYGLIGYEGRVILTHRAEWICKKGPIPEGLQVLHTCDNPSCRNIDHLFLGTNDDNSADKVAKGRQSRLPGETNGFAKLTEAEVREIRAIKDTPQWVIAAMYGVSKSLVSVIRCGEAWKHLEV